MNQAKAGRYERIIVQVRDLIQATDNPISRMATINALLHHKMQSFFWTGFYLLHHGELVVGPYQGPLACLKLKKNTGVCWAGINNGEIVVVPDVHQFPGHIACSPLSRSEIVVPLRDAGNRIIGVLDIDSKDLNAFDEVDRTYLEKLVGMIYG
ncbi:MAG: GAF domain-containing protein [Breznakibacter sp.]